MNGSHIKTYIQCLNSGHAKFDAMRYKGRMNALEFVHVLPEAVQPFFINIQPLEFKSRSPPWVSQLKPSKYSWLGVIFDSVDSPWLFQQS